MNIVNELKAALGPLAMAARKQADFLRYRARDATSGVARAQIEAAERWEKLHDEAEEALRKTEIGAE